MLAESNISVSASWTWSAVSWNWANVLQLILSVVGIAGNFVVMLVLLRPKRQRCSTDTLIAALAVADFLTSVFLIPHARVNTLPDSIGSQLFCRIVHSSLFMWISICSSIFTLTTLSLEKFVAVKYPYAFQRIFSPEKSVRYVIGIWVTSVIINAPVPFVVFFRDNQCVFGYPNMGVQILVGTLVFLLEYVIPVVVMTFAHTTTIRALNRVQKCVQPGVAKHHCPTASQPTQAQLRRARSRRKIINMFAIVVITFVVCWTPDQICYFALNVGWIAPSFLYSPLYRSFVLLAFVNSCANPFIYAARNANFRKAVREMFASIPRRSLKTVFDSVSDTPGGTQPTNQTPLASMETPSSTV
ncbi:galanin receptor 2b-like [Diadema antillarum]|uniref:galanin receptor 2b-like n=1 Tax=Diadema antillarum TaxID=105358 RepID=UPI003A8579BC